MGAGSGNVIEGIPTAITAFVGNAPSGLLNTAVRIGDIAHFEREFAGLARDNELGHAVRQFFLNGGTEAWIVRVAHGLESADLAAAIKGDPVDKTGIYALDEVDLLNLLCIPTAAQLDDPSFLAVTTEAMAYCRTRRAFLILDPPRIRAAPEGLADWLKNGIPADENSALYFPFIMVRDPANSDQLVSLPPSGTVAGVYARTDAAQGIWKSPAGTDAALMGTEDLAYHVSDEENGLLTALGVNCLRCFPGHGCVAWGARTMAATGTVDEYQYVPIRRLSLFIEESIDRGTEWVVFEPNCETLWAEVRLNANEFLHKLFVKGALAGTTPEQAYFVKCGRETMTQDDVDQGLLNVVVGFAPMQPAEFVIIEIQHRRATDAPPEADLRAVT